MTQITQTIYLAEPIDLDPGAEITRRFVASIARDLADAGYNVYRPATAWSCAGVDRRVEQVNRAALGVCDAVVAYLPAGTPTIGVPMEIQTAIISGLPIVVLTNIVSMSLAGSHLITPVGDIADVSPALREALATHPGRTVPPTGPELLKVTISASGQLPSRAYHDDAGLDLYTSEDVIIEPGEFADVPTGIAVELPDWSWGMITGRSSTLRHRKLMVYPAVIDPGYRGPLFAAVWNLSDEPVGVKAGERVAQLIIHENATRKVTPVQATELSAHARGGNGFGSSGV